MTGGSCGSSIKVTQTSPRLLVVDDSAAIRDSVAQMLKFSGYQTSKADGADEARVLVAHEPPSLLITDLNMPFGNGWELITYCHAHHPELPILIVSGEPPGARPEIERHAKGFLSKPFNFHELLAEVARLLPAHTAFAAAH